MEYIGNLCDMINSIINLNKDLQNNIFLAGDDNPISTTQLIQYIANGLDKKIVLFQIPLFETIIKLLKPNIHKRLFQSLTINNHKTKQILNFTN